MAKKKVNIGGSIIKKIGDSKKVEPKKEEQQKEKESLKTRSDYNYKLVYLSEEVHRLAKIKAAASELSIKDYIEQLINEAPLSV